MAVNVEISMYYNMFEKRADMHRPEAPRRLAPFIIIFLGVHGYRSEKFGLEEYHLRLPNRLVVKLRLLWVERLWYHDTLSNVATLHKNKTRVFGIRRCT